jgi:hypothetical protein
MCYNVVQDLTAKNAKNAKKTYKNFANPVTVANRRGLGAEMDLRSGERQRCQDGQVNDENGLQEPF